MKLTQQSLLILFISIASTSAHAAWSAKCLNDCFSTGHECNYCNYQCEVDEPRRQDNTPTPTCPIFESKIY